jgi:hypothetical protein
MKTLEKVAARGKNTFQILIQKPTMGLFIIFIAFFNLHNPPKSLAQIIPSQPTLDHDSESKPQSTLAPKRKNHHIEYSEFYTIDEDDIEQASSSNSRMSTEPGKISIGAELSPTKWLQPIKLIVVNLLKWALHNQPFGTPIEKYDRKFHFGHWINDPNDETCMNTRARVLVRDSESQVTFKNDHQCVVEGGQWHDPYANQELLEAKKIQIDHMVPLKNAYISGASEWDYQTRCLYANYMNFQPHLVSALAHENMSKGDRGPERYMPPNEDYRCEYVRNWLAIKTIWKLKMNRDEIQAIHNTVSAYHCQLNSFKMSLNGLAQQRAFIQANLTFCSVRGR